MESTTKAENLLREAGIRVTAPRLAVLKHLLETDIHPTCEQIYTAVNKESPSLSLASVYNVTEKLSEEKLLVSILAPDGSRHFDGITTLHGHFFCVDCGRILDIPFQQKDVQAGLPGSVISSVSFSVRGYCPSCVKIELKERSKKKKD